MVVKYRLAPDEPYSIKKMTVLNMTIILIPLVFCGPQPWWFLGLLGALWFVEFAAWGITRRHLMRNFWKTVDTMKQKYTGIPQEVAEGVVVRLWEHRGLRVFKEDD
jgi:hypothetical protein